MSSIIAAIAAHLPDITRNKAHGPTKLGLPPLQEERRHTTFEYPNFYLEGGGMRWRESGN